MDTDFSKKPFVSTVEKVVFYIRLHLMGTGLQSKNPQKLKYEMSTVAGGPNVLIQLKTDALILFVLLGIIVIIIIIKPD